MKLKITLEDNIYQAKVRDVRVGVGIRPAIVKFSVPVGTTNGFIPRRLYQEIAYPAQLIYLNGESLLGYTVSGFPLLMLNDEIVAQSLKGEFLLPGEMEFFSINDCVIHPNQVRRRLPGVSYWAKFHFIPPTLT